MNITVNLSQCKFLFFELHNWAITKANQYEILAFLLIIKHAVPVWWVILESFFDTFPESWFQLVHYVSWLWLVGNVVKVPLDYFKIKSQGVNKVRPIELALKTNVWVLVLKPSYVRGYLSGLVIFKYLGFTRIEGSWHSHNSVFLHKIKIIQLILFVAAFKWNFMGYFLQDNWWFSYII